ncbi:MAG: nitrogenase molybdenum-iron protein subunit beta [Actinobacteria bacterium HGW-Actinobacteria-1]|jgi:nitrogenase molybdenum-iron protein beta chain|nr:MAG: nitrogenase molybdenum-iron protein subunit beta [Actinobacteria bacterium HGW-Actinobacteria-1]
MRIQDHNELFDRPEYQEQFERKREFENGHGAEKVAEVAEWTKSAEYRELNFAREAVSINPCKACQPLGAIYAALGFEKTMPFVQGSQGCTAYFRSFFTRHFKEPIATVSSSMTEDAAVFGGLSNMTEGLENAHAVYKPEMIAVSTTCMAEVIGDDLKAYIKQAKIKGAVPEEMPVPFAHTPSFQGSHLNGYDVMLKGILTELAGEKAASDDGSINVIPGFDTYPGNLREIKRMLSAMGVKYRMLADNSDVVDAPNFGTYDLYPEGGTKLADAAQAINAKATVMLQNYSTLKTAEYIKGEWEQEVVVTNPIGIQGTDAFLEEVTRLTGVAVPHELEVERGRAVDAMIDSHPYVFGKRFALVGDPDMLLGLISFLLELGARPVHVVCTNGDKKFKKAAEALLASSPAGADATVWIRKDMWHLRSLMFTEPVDLLMGPSSAKFLWRDTRTPLIRVGFPIHDRHHLYKTPIVGYEGATNLLTMIVNTVLEELDRASIDTTSFDLVR